MTALAAATALFILTHFVPSTPLRPALVRAMGEWPYRGAYSLVAFAALAWMSAAYMKAPVEPLWAPLREAPLILVPLAFILLACGYGRNPTMVGADKLLRSEEPARGVIRVTRHPLMWAIMLWAFAHLLARADLRGLIFFGGLFLVAGLGTMLIDRRKKSDSDWARFAAVTSNVPFLAIAQGRNHFALREIGWLRPLAGIVAFVAFFTVHSSLFGARPW
jgi:uncharacterized membrane protein